MNFVKSATRACFRTDKDAREAFDSHTRPHGLFIVTKYHDNMHQSLSMATDADFVWSNLSIPEKIQAALRAKELCTLKHFHDFFI